MDGENLGRQTVGCIEVAHLKILEQYLGQEKDGVAMDERDRAVANLLLGKLMYSPAFSYMGCR